MSGFSRNSNDVRAYLKMQQGMAGRASSTTPDPNVRWGKRTALVYGGPAARNGSVSATFVSSAMFKDNTPIAFALRFGDPNNPDFPLRPYIQPGTYGLDSNIKGFEVTVTRSIDAKTGPVTDTVDLGEGEAMPACELLCRQLTIAVTVFALNPTSVTIPWVIEVTAAPVNSINCDSLTEVQGWDTVNIPPQGPFITPVLQGYLRLVSGVVNAAPVQSKLLIENPRRTQFSIMNVGTIPVAIGFGPVVAGTGGPANIPGFPSWGLVATGSLPFATLILPGNTDPTKDFARYESPLDGFTGEVWGCAQPGNNPTEGVIVVTEGTKPVL